MTASKAARLAWRILNAAAKSEVDVDIYDIIGDPWGDGPSAADFVRDLRTLDVERINFHINSPGGFVTDALAMYAAIQAHSAETVGYVEGSADSAASFLLQAMDRRLIAKNASMTIHEGYSLAIGPADLLRSIAAELDDASDNIASIYAERGGGTIDEWRGRMKAGTGNRGTTYRGQAAVDIGLCDEVGLAMRNLLPGRIAAQTNPPAAAGSGMTLPADFGQGWRESATYSPKPLLEELLAKQSLREGIAAG